MSKFLDALESRYLCLSKPLPPGAAGRPNDINDRRYLTTLEVYGNREVDDEPRSPPTFDPQIIKKKITDAFSGLSFRDPHVLAQFWSPVTLGKSCLLTTLEQPFGIGVRDEGLYLYRLKSEENIFLVDGEKIQELVLPGRVFRKKSLEYSLDVHTPQTRQCLHDLAASYNISGYVYLPVFEPDSGSCVGVIELRTSSNNGDYLFMVQEVRRALKEVQLKSPKLVEDPGFYIQDADERRGHDLEEIFNFIKAICLIHKLPLAQTWAVSGKLEQSCGFFNKSSIGEICMSTVDLPCYVRSSSMWKFREACKMNHLYKSRGVVGKSLASGGTCFCRDVTELNEDEYNLVPYARLNGITSCLAVFLKSIERDVKYVIELVLPPHNANETDLQSLMETVKHQIKKSRTVKLGVISSLEVIGGDPLSWNLESSASITLLSERESEVPHESGNQKMLVQNEQMKKNVDFCLDVGTEDSNINQREMINGSSNKPSRKWKGTDLSLDEISKHFGKTAKEAAFSLRGIEDSETNQGETIVKFNGNSNKPSRKRKGTDLSLEEISKHFGKTAKEAAFSLRVSKSTLTRRCRSLNVSRWPSKKGLESNKTNIVISTREEALTPVFPAYVEPLVKNITTHDLATLGLHEQVQTNLPDGLAQPEATIGGQYIENTTAATTVKIVTIKATYNKATVKFPFMLSDGLVKLEKSIATRFQLSLGSFSLKYKDEDGDVLLIACDSALKELAGDITQLDIQTVIRLLVFPIVHQSHDA